MSQAESRSVEAQGISRYAVRTSRAALVLATLAVGTTLFFAHEMFVPVALALLFSLVLSSPVEALHRRRVPRIVGAFLMLLLILGGVGAVTNALIEPAQQWLVTAPRTLQILERKIRPAESIIQRLEGLSTRAAQLGNGAPAARGEKTTVAAAPHEMTGTDLITATGATIASVVTVIILTLFLLSGGPPMLARMAASLAADLQAAHVLEVIEAVRKELGRYYTTIALINLGFGIAVGVAMRLIGVPNPFLWGAIAGVLNFIPYVGSALSLLLLAVVSLVSFNDMARVLGVVGAFLALATFEGQVVQPLLVGRRLDLNPILVFLAVWFGGWFWGVAGIVIAVPALAALKVVACHGKDSSPIAEFLSPTDSETLKSFRKRVTSAGARIRPTGRSAA